MLVRILIGILLTCAALALFWLASECYKFAQSMPDHGWNTQVLRIVALLIANLIFTGIVATIGLLFLWVRLARSLPDLQGWHLQKPETEFTASDAVDGFTFDDYLQQEADVFEELDSLIDGPWAKNSPGAFSRYHAESVCNPETIVDRNWNRSYVLEATDPVGGVLLVHGLSDAPYSLRHWERGCMPKATQSSGCESLAMGRAPVRWQKLPGKIGRQRCGLPCKDCAIGCLATLP